eukprot:scaffold19114_cov118-Isochrysis_galbana.AAC.7
MHYALCSDRLCNCSRCAVVRARRRSCAVRRPSRWPSRSDGAAPLFAITTCHTSSYTYSNYNKPIYRYSYSSTATSDGPGLAARACAAAVIQRCLYGAPEQVPGGSRDGGRHTVNLISRLFSS